MKVKSMVAMRADRNGGTCLGRFVALAAVATLLLASTTADSAGPGSKADGKGAAVRFEEIPGSKVKRVILTEKAVERLGIETGEISEAPIVRKQMVGGRVVLPVERQPEAQLVGANGFVGFGQVTAAAQPAVVSATEPDPAMSWIRVTLSLGEWERMQQDKPARVLPLATRYKMGKPALAQPSGIPPVVDTKRSMLALYYLVPGKNNGLELNQRVRVELLLAGSGEKRLVAPYKAVYYDGEGTAWVYVNPKPLVFERQRIVIERVVGELAVLTDGPPVGTKVVTVGAALLYGAEVIYKR